MAAAVRPEPKPRKAAMRRPKSKPQQPARQSARLKGEAASLTGASELAVAQVNGACPRCGKVRYCQGSAGTCLAGSAVCTAQEGSSVAGRCMANLSVLALTATKCQFCCALLTGITIGSQQGHSQGSRGGCDVGRRVRAGWRTWGTALLRCMTVLLCDRAVQLFACICPAKLTCLTALKLQLRFIWACQRLACSVFQAAQVQCCTRRD